MNDTTAYIIESSLWSVAGLVLGYVLGRTLQEVSMIYERVVRRHADEP